MAMTMTYDNNFLHKCEELYKKIKENKTIQECLNEFDIYEKSSTTISLCSYEPLWFVYYMFFAIHNPKMEEYIQKKTNTANTRTAWQDIVKNMIKRRHYTSTVVFRLYTHAYTTHSNVTHIYPKYKGDILKQLIKSYQSNHLKTTIVLIRRLIGSHIDEIAPEIASIFTSFIDYVITTAPTISSASTSTAVMRKINNYISYSRKEIIVIALLCYMKIEDADINKKNIFIAATQEEVGSPQAPTTAGGIITRTHETSIASATTTTASTVQSCNQEVIVIYDEKYKYLYT